MDMIRQRVAERLSIPVDNVMLNCSHTHSGPSLMTRAGEKDARIAAYIEELAQKIVTICSQASTFNYKCRLFHATYTAYLGYNRRYELKDDKGKRSVKMLFNLWWHPGQDINGSVDPDIPILLIERVDEEYYDPYFAATGMDRVVLFNVPIHPVVMGQTSRYVSADYPGAARRCIENVLGDGTKAMFLLGTCGNVNPLLACQDNPRAIEVIGNAIGYGVCAALSNRKKIDFDKLDAITEVIKLNVKEDARTTKIVTQVFKIGKAAIAAVCCECFNELGVRIRKESDFDQTLVAELSNGGGGYIPTRDVLAEGVGGYESESAKRAGFDENLLDNMGDTVIKSLKKLVRK